MKLQTALESANSFDAILKIADRSQRYCSFLGTSKYEGTSSMDALVSRVIDLIKKTSKHDGYDNYGDYGSLRLSYSEYKKAKALANRIDKLYSTQPSNYFFFSTFFALIRFLPEKIYDVAWLGKDIINIYPPYRLWTELFRDKLSHARP
jgi:hypothetical protein